MLASKPFEERTASKADADTAVTAELSLGVRSAAPVMTATAGGSAAEVVAVTLTAVALGATGAAPWVTAITEADARQFAMAGACWSFASPCCPSSGLCKTTGCCATAAAAATAVNSADAVAAAVWGAPGARGSVFKPANGVAAAAPLPLPLPRPLPADAPAAKPKPLPPGPTQEAAVDPDDTPASTPALTFPSPPAASTAAATPATCTAATAVLPEGGADSRYAA